MYVCILSIQIKIPKNFELKHNLFFILSKHIINFLTDNIDNTDNIVL